MKVILFVLLCFSPVLAQNGTSKPSVLTTDEAIKIHELVQRQNQQALIMKEAQLTLERTRTAILELEDEIKLWVADQAKKQKIDLTTHQFDFIKLEFVPIKKDKE